MKYFKDETVCTTHEYFLKVICVQKTRKCIIKEMTIQSVGGLTLGKPAKKINWIFYDIVSKGG